MTVWVVLHSYCEEIEEYSTWHLDEFVSVHRSKQAAQGVVDNQTNTEENHYHLRELYV